MHIPNGMAIQSPWFRSSWTFLKNSRNIWNHQPTTINQPSTNHQPTINNHQPSTINQPSLNDQPPKRPLIHHVPRRPPLMSTPRAPSGWAPSALPAGFLKQPVAENPHFFSHIKISSNYNQLYVITITNNWFYQSIQLSGVINPRFEVLAVNPILQRIDIYVYIYIHLHIYIYICIYIYMYVCMCV